MLVVAWRGEKAECSVVMMYDVAAGDVSMIVRIVVTTFGHNKEYFRTATTNILVAAMALK